MKIIDPHIHMINRTTDEYQALAMNGIHTITEPAFWAGFDRTAPGFRDYFNQLTVFEPGRAAKYGVKHYCWIGMNPKESENLELADAVIRIMPEFLDRPTVLGIGEIGLNKNSRNELKAFEKQVALAAERNELLFIHTPHLEDKLKGTRLIMDVLKNEPRISPSRVALVHVELQTIREIVGKGYWYGVTLYPWVKCSPAMGSDIVEIYGADRMWIDSGADWGVSDPLSTLKTASEMRMRGHPESLINKVFYDNPNQFLSQCPKFQAA
jgi:predicted metal-dependent TIM-barrel fold hydrolase